MAGCTKRYYYLCRQLEGQDVTTVKKIKEGIIIFGNESKGISHELLKLANVKITIPKKGKAESLNAAVATGIVLIIILCNRIMNE